MKSVLVETADVTDRERTFADHISEQRLTRSMKKGLPKALVRSQTTKCQVGERFEQMSHQRREIGGNGAHEKRRGQARRERNEDPCRSADRLQQKAWPRQVLVRTSGRTPTCGCCRQARLAPGQWSSEDKQPYLNTVNGTRATALRRAMICREGALCCVHVHLRSRTAC